MKINVFYLNNIMDKKSKIIERKNTETNSTTKKR